MNSIEVQNLSKVYGSTTAIADVNFTVETGEIIGFLGPNGAGKTTTMRILAGYLPATTGTAKIAGIMAAKQTSNLIPLCHPLPLKKVEVKINCDRNLPLINARIKSSRHKTAFFDCFHFESFFSSREN